MEAVSVVYNEAAAKNGWPLYSDEDNSSDCICEIVGFLDISYGKYPLNNAENTILMEYDNFLSWLTPYLDSPDAPQEF